MPHDSAELAKSFRLSVVSYGLRQVAVTLVTVGYQIALTHYLMPEEFGKVAVIMVVVNVAVLLADGGLGVYLIQRRAEVTQHDLSQVATIQLCLAFAMSFSCFVAAFAIWWAIGGGQLPWLVATASLSLPLLVLRGMALLLLERAVQMQRVVRVEILEELCFASVALALAYYGAGAWSVVVAQIFKACVGCVAAIRTSRFRFSITPISWDADLRRGLRFGFHYQAAQLVNMARISVNPLFIVPLLGLQAGGFVERGWYLAGASLSVIFAVQKKVMFPYVSRIQHDLKKVGKLTEESVYVSAVLDKLLFLPVLIFARVIVLRVFGPQWLPMLPLLYWLLAGNIVFGALTGPLYPAASGIGRADLVSRFNLIVFVASWLLIVPLVLWLGIEGVGVAGLLLWAAVHWLKTQIATVIGPFRFYRQILRPLLSFAVTWALIECLLLLTDKGQISLPHVVFWSAASWLIYVILIFLLDWHHFTRLRLGLR